MAFSVQTGKVIISTPAATTMKMTAVTVQRVKLDWSRYYAWRALPSLKAKLSLGEDYLNSDIFDGFNYIGSSVSTDDQMLPPNLRGYAPDVSGVAHSSAKVTISQMGRVLYETQVSRRAIPHSGYRRFCLWHTTRPC